MFATKNHRPFLANKITSGYSETKCCNSRMCKTEMLEIWNWECVYFGLLSTAVRVPVWASELFLRWQREEEEAESKRRDKVDRVWGSRCQWPRRVLPFASGYKGHTQSQNQSLFYLVEKKTHEVSNRSQFHSESSRKTVTLIYSYSFKLII